MLKKKSHPRQKPTIDKLNDRSKKMLLWFLVGIFTVFFVIIGIFSWRLEFSKEGDNSALIGLKNDFSEIIDTFSTSFAKVKEVISGKDDQVVPTNEKINEWEEKVFPEFN